MPNDAQKELSEYRLEKSAAMIEKAEVLFNSHHYKGSNNRSYYAILHSLRAVLDLVGYDSKKHSGVIAEFQRAFVKTNISEREYSKMIMAASEIRNASDYDDYYIASKDEAQAQLANAKKLYTRVFSYIKGNVESEAVEGNK